MLPAPPAADPDDLEAQRLTQNALLGPGETEAGDATGAALAVGDFDDDGFDDLAIGAPGEGRDDSGSVIVAHGGPTGLDLSRVAELLQDPDLGGANAASDNLGQVLATGDVDGDGRDELAIGVPLKDVGGHADAGMVYIHYFPEEAPPHTPLRRRVLDLRWTGPSPESEIGTCFPTAARCGPAPRAGAPPSGSGIRAGGG